MDIPQKAHKKKLVRHRLNTFLYATLSPAIRWSLLSCLLLAFAFGGVSFFLAFRHYGLLPALISYLIFLINGVVLAAIMTLLFSALKRIRWQMFFVIIISAIVSILTVSLLIYLLPLMIFCMIAVYLTAMFATGKYKALGKFKRILCYSLLGLSGTITALLLVLIFWPGPTLERPDVARLALPYADNIQHRSIPILGNPSLPGSYNYTVYFYAAPGQRTNPFPNQTVLPAPSVDASALLEGWSSMRQSRLGFGTEALPLNAQVWMPEGEGAFPLVLIVHGNHIAGNRSDIGYAYLGELLASRGIIVASIEQNFLNISPLYDMFFLSGLENEIGTRAFILLEHLRQWYYWNAEPSHPFYRRVDFERIGLIGHSRGGEAAALAAAFADLSHYPGNGRIVFDYPFQINTVIGIAPTHGMYSLAGLEVYLTGVNYLVIHGGHDKDADTFMGANMYSRVDVSDYGIKASVWMSHANHGQFNTAWGRNDVPGLWRLTTNRRLLMSMEEQQQAAKVFISAFFEATFHGRKEYTALFRYFAYGADWLPPAFYVTAFADSNMVLLDSFDGGLDISISTSGMVTYSAQGFDRWTIAELPGKEDNSNRVLILSWGNEGCTQSYSVQSPIFRMEFAEGTLHMGDRLFISLSSGNENSCDQNVSFQIRLTDISGHTSTLNSNDFGGVTNPIDAHIFSPLLSAITGSTREPVLQMVSIPSERFEGLQGEIVSMEWIMNTVGVEQVLFIDDLRIMR